MLPPDGLVEHHGVHALVGLWSRESVDDEDEAVGVGLQDEAEVRRLGIVRDVIGLVSKIGLMSVEPGPSVVVLAALVPLPKTMCCSG